jgi:hypothetical protein
MRGVTPREWIKLSLGKSRKAGQARISPDRRDYRDILFSLSVKMQENPLPDAPSLLY